MCKNSRQYLVTAMQSECTQIQKRSVSAQKLIMNYDYDKYILNQQRYHTIILYIDGRSKFVNNNTTRRPCDMKMKYRRQNVIYLAMNNTDFMYQKKKTQTNTKTTYAM